MPGNQGGSNWGSTAANPTDGSVYVIGFNVPTIIRLLEAGRDARRTRRRRAGGGRQEGRYVTDGFGLYPTIVNPPYTTLTAYDLNQGTIKWQIGLGDDLRLVGQGITGTGTAATIKGGIIPTATGLVFVTAADRKVHVYDSAHAASRCRSCRSAARPAGRRRCTSWAGGSICSSRRRCRLHRLAGVPLLPPRSPSPRRPHRRHRVRAAASLRKRRG